MDMKKFESEDDPGFVAVVGELRRWIRDLDQSSVADGRKMQELLIQGPTTMGRSAPVISSADVRNTVENRGNVANQALQQTVHGGIHINQLV